jgi:hypothetical protein
VEINAILCFFFQLASTGTNALNAACQHLMAEQTKMSEFSEKLAEKLSHFIRVERIIQKLNSPSLSVMSEAFPKLLDEIDESSAFLEQHVRISFRFNLIPNLTQPHFTHTIPEPR